MVLTTLTRYTTVDDISAIPATPATPATLKPIPAFEIPIDSITIVDRIRQDFGDISDLAESIKNEGLLQPIVVTSDHRLVAGHRRLLAHRHLSRTTINAVYIEVLDEAHLTRLEATENIARKDFSWQERVLAIDKVHRRMTVDSAMKSVAWGVRETGRLLNMAKSPIGLAVFIAEFLHANDDEIKSADSVADAYRIIVRRREDEANKLLVATSMPRSEKTEKVKTQKSPAGELVIPETDFFTPGAISFTPGIGGLEDTEEVPGLVKDGPVIPLSRMLLRQNEYDNIDTLKSLGPDCCDHIISDPPFATGTENQQQSSGLMDVSSVAEEHDIEKNKDLLEQFVDQAYLSIRDKGFLIMWCDISMWESLYTWTVSRGFKTQSWPLIWHKTSSCKNECAQYNFTKNYELAMVCRKGNATLVGSQPSSIWTGGNEDARALGHPYAKPAGLWEWLYKSTCLRGAEVLDPFAGVGSSTIPAVRMGLRPRSIESNEQHYNRAVVNLQNLYKSLDPNVTFA